MNKNVKISIGIAIILFLIVTIFVVTRIIAKNKSNEKYGKWIYNNDFLYDKAINYLKKEKSSNDLASKGKEDYQTFFSYHKFGIKEKNNRKYAYMYILEESYYVKHKKLHSDGKKEMLYKFKFEGDEVVEYEATMEGKGYEKSVKELCPDDIEKKVLKFGTQNLKHNNEIEEHYSYLDSTVVMETDYDENMIVVMGTCKKENSIIEGKCINGYGDVYEYQIPLNNKLNPLEDINNVDNSIICENIGKKIGSISEMDLNEIKSNLKEIDFSTKKVTNKRKELSFIKVAYGNTKNNSGTLILDYKTNDFINLIIDTSEYRAVNASKSGKKIIDILAKYDLSI